MGYIGRGTYGCVVSPPLPCEDSGQVQKTDDMVGKVFFNQKGFLREKEFHEVLLQIDPHFEFTVAYQGTCNANTSTMPAKDITNCRYLFKGQKYPQIILVNGGRDLYDYLEKTKGTLSSFRKLIPKFLSVVKGLQVMVSHGYIHQDIKPENLLWDGNSMKLIDFSLMTKIHEVFSDENDSILTADYPYFPPEYKLSGKRYRRFALFKKDYMYSLDFSIGDETFQDIMDEHHPTLSNDLEQTYGIKDFKQYAHKVDVFSLGMVFAIMYEWADLGKIKKTPYVRKVELMIQQMTHVNPQKRATLSQVAAHLQNL